MPRLGALHLNNLFYLIAIFDKPFNAEVENNFARKENEPSSMVIFVSAVRLSNRPHRCSRLPLVWVFRPLSLASLPPL
jgi:hypothetical protein